MCGVWSILYVLYSQWGTKTFTATFTRLSDSKHWLATWSFTTPSYQSTSLSQSQSQLVPRELQGVSHPRSSCSLCVSSWYKPRPAAWIVSRGYQARSGLQITTLFHPATSHCRYCRERSMQGIQAGSQAINYVFSSRTGGFYNAWYWSGSQCSVVPLQWETKPGSLIRKLEIFSSGFAPGLQDTNKPSTPADPQCLLLVLKTRNYFLFLYFLVQT